MSQDQNPTWAVPAARTLDNFRRLEGKPHAGNGGSRWYLEMVKEKTFNDQIVPPQYFESLSPEPPEPETIQDRYRRAKTELEETLQTGGQITVELDRALAQKAVLRSSEMADHEAFTRDLFDMTRNMSPDEICNLGSKLLTPIERTVAYTYASLQGSRCGYYHMAEMYLVNDEARKIGVKILEELIEFDPDDEWAERARAELARIQSGKE